MNLVAATFYNTKLCIMAFQDVSSSMMSVMVASDVSVMNNYVMNGSCSK